MKMSIVLAIVGYAMFIDPICGGPLDVLNPAKMLDTAIGVVTDPSKTIRHAINNTMETIMDPGKAINEAIDQTRQTIAHPIEAGHKMLRDTTQVMGKGVQDFAAATRGNIDPRADNLGVADLLVGAPTSSSNIQPSVVNLFTALFKAVANSFEKGHLGADVNQGLNIVKMQVEPYVYLFQDNFPKFPAKLLRFLNSNIFNSKILTRNT